MLSLLPWPSSYAYYCKNRRVVLSHLGVITLVAVAAVRTSLLCILVVTHSITSCNIFMLSICLDDSSHACFWYSQVFYWYNRDLKCMEVECKLLIAGTYNFSWRTATIILGISYIIGVQPWLHGQVSFMDPEAQIVDCSFVYTLYIMVTVWWNF